MSRRKYSAAAGSRTLPDCFDLRDLDVDYVRLNIDSILEIAGDLKDEYWGVDNFLKNLYKKWELSFCVLRVDVPIAYAIVSEKGARWCHIHHFMVHEKWRSHSIGGAMIDEVEVRVKSLGGNRITLKVSGHNPKAKAFYERHNYSVLDQFEGYYNLEKRL